MQKNVVSRETIVKESELPISCPPRNTGSAGSADSDSKWNLHPRVFIPLSRAQPRHNCPYCGAAYLLEPPPAPPAPPTDEK